MGEVRAYDGHRASRVSSVHTNQPGCTADSGPRKLESSAVQQTLVLVLVLAVAAASLLRDGCMALTPLAEILSCIHWLLLNAYAEVLRAVQCF